MSTTPQNERAYEMPLKIGKLDDGTPSITLNGIELSFVLAADGVSIQYEHQEWMGRSVPIVTLTFGPGALDVDFEVDLLEAMLAEKKAAQ